MAWYGNLKQVSSWKMSRGMLLQQSFLLFNYFHSNRLMNSKDGFLKKHLLSSTGLKLKFINQNAHIFGYIAPHVKDHNYYQVKERLIRNNLKKSHGGLFLSITLVLYENLILSWNNDSQSKLFLKLEWTRSI